MDVYVRGKARNRSPNLYLDTDADASETCHHMNAHRLTYIKIETGGWLNIEQKERIASAYQKQKEHVTLSTSHMKTSGKISKRFC